ncbi:MAG: M23 family metallopeptidase [Deltaproteobacteria bacterium]
MRSRLLPVACAVLTAVLSLTFLFLSEQRASPPGEEPSSASSESLAKTSPEGRIIEGTVGPGESLFDIFKRNGLDFSQLHEMKQAATKVFRLRDIRPGRPYRIALDADNNVVSLSYRIDDLASLDIARKEDAFEARKETIEYEVREARLGGVIETSLAAALEEKGRPAALALDLSDIFSWDIDFTTDIRKGDVYRVVVEELWLNGECKRYGEVLSAEFENDGTVHRAYRFEVDGRVGYYDDEGDSMRRAFLKAPLSYRRISSGFSLNRFHPILKRRHPHLGVDYVAPAGTPVSAIGDGTVTFAGWKGANGRLVILQHPMGYTTYYGHLSRIAKGIRRGVRVAQGDLIGYVGSSGRATGPHLHFQMNRHGRILNPLSVKLPRGRGIPKSRMKEFRDFRAGMQQALASIPVPAADRVEANRPTEVASNH